MKSQINFVPTLPVKPDDGIAIRMKSSPAQLIERQLPGWYRHGHVVNVSVAFDSVIVHCDFGLGTRLQTVPFNVARF